jgi:hypothetical protein
MKIKTLFLLLFLGLISFNCFGNDGVPMAISPGMAGGVGVVEDRCPTFSWSGVAWAEMYRVVVFGVEDAITQTAGEIKLSAKPLLSEDIAGGLSWTPSVSQGLAAGADYSWYVGAMDAGGAWSWSEPRRFRVEASAKPTLIAGDSSAQKQQVRKAEANDKAALPTPAGSAAGTALGKKGKANDPAYGSEGIYSTFYGTNAGANNTSDTNANSFFGGSAGHSNTTGTWNTFMGFSTGTDNTTGIKNTFIGYLAGTDNTTGYNNTFIGHTAGFSNTTGYYNTFIGNEAGHANITGGGNVFLGYSAGYNESGWSKLYIDNSNTSAPLIYGDFSTDKVGINGWLGVGTQTPAYPMELKTTGRAATFVLTRTDGGAINFINANASYGQFGTVNNFAVRILVNSNWRMALNTDNSLNMVSGASCTAGGVWTNASSRALKENISDLEAEEAMVTLKGLNPVRFTYKADKSDEQVGFIAEDVPELVATKDHKGMSAMDIVAVLTKVVQEQQKEISFLKDKLSALEKKVEAEK